MNEQRANLFAGEFLVVPGTGEVVMVARLARFGAVAMMVDVCPKLPLVGDIAIECAALGNDGSREN